MVYTLTDSPLSGNILAVDQPLMRANFQYLTATLGTDHQIALNDMSNASGEGYHKEIHFVQQGGDPGAIATIGQLYTKAISGDTCLFFKTGAGLIQQLTTPVSPANATSGTSFLPGGIMIQWGTNTPASDPQTVTFNQAFGANAFAVIATPITNAHTSCTVQVTNITSTTFDFRTGNPSKNPIYYIAIGTK